MKSIVLATAVLVAASITVRADTIAWWHFDEDAPGTKAQADTIAPDQAPTHYATPEAMSAKTIYAAGSDEYDASAYAPTYTRPFRGRVIYDPVTDTYRTNSAAMRFNSAKGTYPAEYGGCIKVPNTQSLLSPCSAAFTVEAFVCTTGKTTSVANNFAPLVASVNGTKFTSEQWALYMDVSGSTALGGLSIRLGTSAGYCVKYGSGGATATKINDGNWHHVAYTYDSALETPAVKLYIDHVLAKTWAYNPNSSDANDKKITGTISYGDDNAIYIGGYDNFANSSGSTIYGYRRYPGVIDEVRISNAALAPAQFLRMRPSADTNVILQISFDPDEYETTPSTTKNFSDAIDPDFQKTLYKSNGASNTAFDSSVKAGATVGCGPADDHGVANVAAFHFVTNGTGTSGSYLQASSFSGRFSGHSNYTLECFYKTGGQVRGPTSNRQTLFKGGSDKYVASATLCNESSTGNMGTGGILLSYRDAADGGKQVYDSTADTNLDDGFWHHLAIVIDGDHEEARTYIDGRLSKTRTGYTPAHFSGYSIFIGCAYGGAPQQFFDGWMDNFRVTLRALNPSEFLAANPTGSADASLLALFENDYTFTCASDAAFSVTGTPEARTGGVAPTFVQDSRGTLLLDGTNGTMRARNQYSASFNKSRVVFPPSDLFEDDAYTVEFFAKFTGIAPTNGIGIAAGSKLAQHAPIMRLVRADSPSSYDWYLFRQSGNARSIQLAADGKYPGWILPNQRIVEDGKWHHYAVTFEPDEGGTNTVVSLYYDYAKINRANPETGNPRMLPRRVEGHKLMIGEGTYAEPNMQFEMDALRFSKGILAPWQFIGRDGNPFIMIVR